MFGDAAAYPRYTCGGCTAQRTLITLKRENNGSKLHRHSTFPYVVGNRLNFMICPIFSLIIRWSTQTDILIRRSPDVQIIGTLLYFVLLCR